MNPQLVWILAGGMLCLIGLGGAGLFLLAEEKQKKVWAQRREEAIGPYLKPKGSGGPALVVQVRARQRSNNKNPFFSLVAYNPDLRQHYPMTLPAVFMCMLGPASVGALLTTKVFGSTGWFAMPFYVVLLVRLFHNWATERLKRTLLSQFPDALAMVSRSVRVGVPVTEAVRIVGRESQTPTREEFAKAADGVAIGMDLETALLEMAERNDISEYRFFATALALQAQTGGGLTETLETLADTIRKRENARKRGHALASEARTSIYVLAVLPIVIGAMLFVINPDYISELFIKPMGEKLLGLACGLLIMGLFVMQQIIKRSLA